VAAAGPMRRRLRLWTQDGDGRPPRRSGEAGVPRAAAQVLSAPPPEVSPVVGGSGVVDGMLHSDSARECIAAL
jgi:hypothetical protein